MFPFIGFVIGAALGAMLDRHGGSFLALSLVGVLFGLWLQARSNARAAVETDQARHAKLLERIYALELRIADLARRASSGAPAEVVAPAPSAEAPTAARPDATVSTPEPTPAPIAVPAAPSEIPSWAITPLTSETSVPVSEPEQTRAQPRVPAYMAGAEATAVASASESMQSAAAIAPEVASASASVARAAEEPDPITKLWRWLVGGNLPARVGILILLIGVGFLLKFAVERVYVPPEFRLAGVALGGIALLVVGWRLRSRRGPYAMILEGGGVGVLYLTVFAGLRLYQLVSPEWAFALLVAVAALSSFLAVSQNSLALAAIGVLGGFFAPVLTSTQSGNHVMLFSYYALLNAAIFGMAWFKAWRSLNLLGFVCTFGIGTLWGVLRYRPENLWTTEPFLVLFFLFYVGIAVFYALRRRMEVSDPIDGTLVFATPLVCAALQSVLMRDVEYGLAWSAVGAALVYLSLGTVLYGRYRDDLRLLCQAFLALGVVFATLAIPLAFDARWTSATWALEGAALVWIGVRQRHMAPRLFGFALQLAAGIAFLGGAFAIFGTRYFAGTPVLNRDFLGTLLIAVAGFFSSLVVERNRDAVKDDERLLAPMAFIWATGWWFGGGWREIDRFVALRYQIAAHAAFLAGSGLAFALVSHALKWRSARLPAFAMFPALFVLAFLFTLVHAPSANLALLNNAGWIAWPLSVLALIVLLLYFERAPDEREAVLLDFAHPLALWLATLAVVDTANWAAANANLGYGWRVMAWGFIPALALLLVSSRISRTSWPQKVRQRAYLVYAAIPIVVLLGLWSLGANIASDGDPSPLPYLPLVNPLDIAQAVAIVAAFLWLSALREEKLALAPVAEPGSLVVPAVVALLFLATMELLRTIHHWIGVPWSFDALWRSLVVQASLSILWSAFALAAMVISNRRGERIGWIAGATLLGVVVAKLFLVDLSAARGIERIVSFIGVGLLLLLIGYLTPVPPRRKENLS
jgi:uncharacterized membrane protein